MSDSATSAENATQAASVKPNSRNSRPRSPGKNEIGTKTEISVIVVAITAKPISRVPVIAATSDGSPSSVRRWTFSSTTIASSTTRPIASTSPSSVSTLIEYPSAYITVSAATIDTGIVTAGTSVVRRLPRKR